MTSEEFWKDDPKLFYSYQKAYVEKTKKENILINYSKWLQGLYIHDALKKDLTDYGYAFVAGKKNPNKETYPNEPYDLFGDKEKRDSEKKKMEQKKNQEYLNFWATIKK